MPQPIDEVKAYRLYEALGVTVANVNPQPREHAGEQIFCGYADLLFFLEDGKGDPLPLVRLNSNAIKIINGTLHFDPKSEKGKGDKKGQYFPHWLPLGPEARAVLTAKLEALPEIQELMAIARGTFEAVQEETGS